MSAISRVFGWQTTTCPAGARASSVHQPSRQSWRERVRSGSPSTVQTGPASRVPGAIALMAGGSTK